MTLIRVDEINPSVETLFDEFEKKKKKSTEQSVSAFSENVTVAHTATQQVATRLLLNMILCSCNIVKY